jgi:N-acetylneuraminate synthase
MAKLKIAERWIGESEPTYFIADIAANHDGSLDRALRLIEQAAAAGAAAAKFQHFRADKIVSRSGFDAMGRQLSHQAKWKKSVFDVYRSASIPWDWTAALKKACDGCRIHFLSAPYDLEAVDMLDPYVPAFKIGSGDITWLEELEHVARKNKPILLATGASDLIDVQRAVDAVLPINPRLLLMQCNTNYSGQADNFRHIELNVLNTYARLYPELVLGLSDHTTGHAVVLGAVALGARAIEKHFTDDRSREGPDHHFSLEPAAFQEMVQRTRELENALGTGIKAVQPNEAETVVIQRRCLRAARDLPAGTVLKRPDLEPLRPAPRDGIFPYDLANVIGRTLRHDVSLGDYLRWTDLD